MGKDGAQANQKRLPCADKVHGVADVLAPLDSKHIFFSNGDFTMATAVDVLPPNITDMSLLNPELLQVYEALQENFGIWKLYVNEWDGKRINRWCGYRTKECTIGAINSAHKRGLALDLHAGSPYADIGGKQARNTKLWTFLQSWGHEYGVKRLEDIDATPTWCHIDLVEKAGWNHKEKVYVFKP